jgi:hypothetical protein
MTDGQMEWPVPVVTKADAQRRVLIFTVDEEGEVVADPPRTPFIIPASSDDQLCDAIRDARKVAKGMGQGLS